MRLLRPLHCLVVLALLAAVAPPASARVSAVGLIDYTKKNFKIGDWVRYRVEASNSKGMEDVKQQEVRVVGEETYRGEKCFWLETWYGPDQKTADYDLTLISYAIFKDVAPDVHYRNYMRLILVGLDDDGVPEMNDLQRSGGGGPPPDLRQYRGKIDTLGVEKVATGTKGAVEARLERLVRRLIRTHPGADSTINLITVTTRKTWFSREIPVTGVAREDEETEKRVQAYRLGTPSTDAPETLSEAMTRTATIVDWGTGAHSELLQQWRDKRGLLRAKAGGSVGLDDEASPR
ncbi:MAG: hypothetical protein ABIP29_10355 [Candidatus Eisenbacteria bacterium]